MLKRLLCVIVCACLLLVAGGCKEDVPAAAQSGYDTTAGYRRTMLYYPDDGGYMVPIMKYIPWEEGIGKAALSYLTDTEDNRLSAAQMGLNTVIPGDAGLSLRIRDDGVATVDIQNLSELESAEAERMMVTAIVNTLVEFPAIEKVRITLDGSEARELTHGTNISEPMAAFPLNQDETELAASAEGAVAMTLYYPNLSASLNIPVTRYTAMEPTLETRIASLVSGPTGEGLLNCFPAGTALIGAGIDNNIAKLDFSSEFAALENDADMLLAAYESLYLTAKEAGGVYALEITVNGKSFDMGAVAASAPAYPNTFR